MEKPTSTPVTRLPTMARRLQQQASSAQSTIGQKSVSVNHPPSQDMLSHVPQEAATLKTLRNVTPRPFARGPPQTGFNAHQNHRPPAAAGVPDETRKADVIREISERQLWNASPREGDHDQGKPTGLLGHHQGPVLSNAIGPNSRGLRPEGNPIHPAARITADASSSQPLRAIPRAETLRPWEPHCRLGEYLGGLVLEEDGNGATAHGDEEEWGMRGRAIPPPPPPLPNTSPPAHEDPNAITARPSLMSSGRIEGRPKNTDRPSTEQQRPGLVGNAKRELRKVHLKQSHEDDDRRNKVGVQEALETLDGILNELGQRMDPKEASDEARDEALTQTSKSNGEEQVSALMEHLAKQADQQLDDSVDKSRRFSSSDENESTTTFTPRSSRDASVEQQGDIPSQSGSRKTSHAEQSESRSASHADHSESRSASHADHSESRKASHVDHSESRKASHVDHSESRKASHADQSGSWEQEDQVDKLTKQMVESLETREVVNWSQDIKSTGIFGACPKCDLPIEKEASVCGDTHYHPNCFTCEGCNEPLGTQRFFIIGGKNYCAKDRERFLEKCVKCQETIEGDTIRPRESGEAYHPSCFSCQRCSRELFGKYYDINGSLICEDDYIASRDKCFRCRDPIIGTTLKALDESYHPECFTCSACPLCLDGVQYFLNEHKQPLCEPCYARLAAKRCDGCQKPIVEDCLVSKDPGGFYHKTCYTENVGPSRS